ncbi:hypothetical protein ACFE04_004748 [Oxalis oulophora]
MPAQSHGDAINNDNLSGFELEEASIKISFEFNTRKKRVMLLGDLLLTISVYGSSVNNLVYLKCLSVIGKLTFFHTEMIWSLLSATNISYFLVGVLIWKDPYVLIPTLQVVEILIEKLPRTFSKSFNTENVRRNGISNPREEYKGSANIGSPPNSIEILSDFTFQKGLEAPFLNGKGRHNKVKANIHCGKCHNYFENVGKLNAHRQVCQHPLGGQGIAAAADPDPAEAV